MSNPVVIDPDEAVDAIRESLEEELRALGVELPADRIAAAARNVASAVVNLDRRPTFESSDPDYHTAEQNGVGRYEGW